MNVGWHYGPMSYHTLGRVYPRHRQRDPFVIPAIVKRRRLLGILIATFVPGAEPPPAYHPGTGLVDDPLYRRAIAEDDLHRGSGIGEEPTFRRRTDEAR